MAPNIVRFSMSLYTTYLLILSVWLLSLKSWIKLIPFISLPCPSSISNFAHTPSSHSVSLRLSSPSSLGNPSLPPSGLCSVSYWWLHILCLLPWAKKDLKNLLTLLPPQTSALSLHFFFGQNSLKTYVVYIGSLELPDLSLQIDFYLTTP